MLLIPGRYVFCERQRISDICYDIEGIRIDHEGAVLEGYQVYLVEQWAIERNREVATAVSFTGDPIHQILVTTITIQHANVSCPRLEKVFEKLRKEGAKPKETPYGQLFVTNLSLFASSLNIVLVPKQGDFDLYQQRFYLNLDLRRMGCSGRSALTSKSPSDAQREKFNQLYKISDSTDFEVTVLRLVVLVQNCLYIFGLFNLSDVDGLLCNATEKGLEVYYDTFLKTSFQKFPTPDNLLDPNVLAGMFSKLSNVRGKLQHMVSNVPKDPFAEPVAFLNAVKTFQIKKPDLKACFLDAKTVEAISAAYQSSFNPQGLKVHKVLKSKIEDFSGMTTVNPEGETTDLEVFAKHITTDSLKQVWKGKTKQKTDVADALANGDWLTGGKELGKSLVRGLAKTSLLLPKAKQGNALANIKEGTYTDDTLVSAVPQDHIGARSDDEKNDGCESDEGLVPTVVQSSVTILHAAPEEETNPETTGESSQQPPNAATPSLDTLNSLFSQKPEPRGQPEIVAFYLDRKNYPSGRKRSTSMSGLVGQERLLGYRAEGARSTGGIPGITIGSYRKIVKHPAHRKRSQSYSCVGIKDSSLKPLKSVVVECDTQSYYTYQLLKEKEETLKNVFNRMQTMEKEFSSQLDSLKAILADRGKQFEEIEHDAAGILAERRDLLAEVREKEHATQRSVYHLEGMVGKLVEMRDFTGAFFNKISYLDTKLPVSQRRLALWMDKLQALQSQWFGTIGRYMVVYAPSGIRGRFVDWERDVQIAAMKARELRGEVGDIQLGGAPSPPTISTTTTSASTAGSPSTAETGPIVGTSTARSMPMPSAAGLGPLGLFSRKGLKRSSGDSPSHGGGSSYMVTPQSLKTEGKDSEKDVREYLQRRATDHESLYGIQEQGDDSTTESPMLTSSLPGSDPMYSSQH
ncbi:hypothetical protein BGZ96_007868 [Linnemannia gamsii]|uniref:STB6-like N-terminal domain-containing protein n=1 Tax=Linnemannia gamsii TaxID=64522 RepID=A0ABQ7JZP5_9FUNG|nr:hypothetical protein BGZ96_007868 [Linnemannia gamsii]